MTSSCKTYIASQPWQKLFKSSPEFLCYCLVMMLPNVVIVVVTWSQHIGVWAKSGQPAWRRLWLQIWAVLPHLLYRCRPRHQQLPVTGATKRGQLGYVEGIYHSKLTHWPWVILQWRHNMRDSVSNHQPHHCLLNRLFRRRSKKTSKLRVTGFCVGNSPGTGEFPAQMASYAENVSIWWRHDFYRYFLNII